jgi:hypothetical protein
MERFHENRYIEYGNVCRRIANTLYEVINAFNVYLSLKAQISSQSLFKELCQNPMFNAEVNLLLQEK